MKRILTNKEYRFIKELKELMTKYNAVISTDAQGKIEIVVSIKQTCKRIYIIEKSLIQISI